MENNAVLAEVVPASAIITELLTYAFFSVLIILLMDWYAAKKIGGRRKPGYQALTVPRHVALYLMGGFTIVMLLLCLYADFTVTRGTLSYFGIPYFIGLAYYLMKMLQRVRAETKKQ